MNYTILIADDEPEIRTLLRLYLENENYQIIEAENGKQALELLKKEHVDLCLLDIMMPEMDGYHVLQELRKTSNIPVMILSAKDADSEKILGLNLGADDYLAKPFEIEELDARLRALLRRSAGQVQGIQLLGELAFHDEGYFLLQGQPLALTPREQALLTVLMYRRLRPVSRQQLFEQVFSLSDEVSPESIELYIHRLRKKLQGSDVRIATLRGLGYVLERSDEVG